VCGGISKKRKALPGFFLCIFSSIACLKKPVFSKRDLPRWKKVPARLYWILLTSERCQPASLSLFLKRENIPAQLYFKKGPEYIQAFCCDFQPVPSAYPPGHGSETTEGPILRPFSYT
jgi:hypothetical protein